MRFITTLFCYGCNLGQTQAKSIKGLSRRQVSWLNLKYVAEDLLDKAIVKVMNAYNKFELPGYWGSGKHASADGTKWNLYEQNLLSSTTFVMADMAASVSMCRTSSSHCSVTPFRLRRLQGHLHSRRVGLERIGHSAGYPAWRYPCAELSGVCLGVPHGDRADAPDSRHQRSGAASTRSASGL